MPWTSSKSEDQVQQVYPLSIAENNLLQVLVHCFSLERTKQGIRLRLEFDTSSPTIRRREAKQYVKTRMPHFERDKHKLQTDLESILLRGTQTEFAHDSEEFVFRYSNGGTLPLVHHNGTKYYCLFYRDVDPIGWNIANGASDTLAELLNPSMTIEREFCEEFIAIDMANQIDYMLSWGNGDTIDRPEYQVARQHWSQYLAGHNLSDFSREPLHVQWHDAPDSLSIQFGQQTPQVWSGGYLNINAVDFGIEVDRVATLKLSSNTILLDGEIK